MGFRSDYFVTLCRTGGEGAKGLSMILIEKNMPGFGARRMKMQGITASGTAFLTFENIKVPISNLIGDEGNGFIQSMYNFNQERFGLGIAAINSSRCLLSESIKFAMKRKTFGKRLIDHAVIRNKLGHMIRQIEAAYALGEQIAYQLDKMNPTVKMIKLPGPISLFKVHAGQLIDYCAREAVQIFGGLG